MTNPLKNFKITNQRIVMIAAIVFIAAVALFHGCAAHAQESLRLASGDEKQGSTYHVMVKELVAQCGATAGVVNHLTVGGGVVNRELLLTNKVHMSVVPADMLEFTRRADPSKVAAIKTLFALHEEEVHTFVSIEGAAAAGIKGMFGKKESIDNFSQLNGRKVGAVGGSVDTARVMSAAGGVNYTVNVYANNDDLKAAMVKGDIDAAIAVGGAPFKFAESLTSGFRLLPMPKELIAKMVAAKPKMYSATTLSYANLAASAVPTVSTTALVVTRTYRSQEMNQRLNAFKNCFQDRLSTIQDALGTHAKWQDVKADYTGGWPMYDFGVK